MKWAKGIWKTALIAGAAALILFLVLPVFGASHFPDADRLRLTEDDGDYVGYEGFFYGSDQPGTATSSQPLTNSKGCLLNSTAAGPLVTLGPSPSGKIKGPGFTQLGIGVKSGGSNGTPCAETSMPEVLEITSYHAWYRMDLDVQPKSNAWIEVRMYNGGTSPVATHWLVTGSSIEAYNALPDPDVPPANAGLPYRATTTGVFDVRACANPNDSGLDSGPNDNCYWTLTPGLSFTYVEIEALVGSVALEGGNDFEGTGLDIDGKGFEDGGFDSLFHRIPFSAVDDDFYEMDERDPGVPPILATLEKPGTSGVNVLDNDIGDLTVKVVELPPEGMSNTEQGGRFTIGEFGSFEYTPPEMSVGDWVALGAFSYQDTFEYTVYDSLVGATITDIATVTVTVHRVICSGDIVSHSDTHKTAGFTVTGAFKLLSSGGECKPYLVVAYAGDGEGGLGLDPTVTFTPFPNGDGGIKEEFSGRLTFDPQPSMGGGFFVGLTYSRDNIEPADRALLACKGPLTGGPPVIGPDGFVVEGGARLPNEDETWCLAGGSWIANAAGTHYIPTAIVFGLEDPRFGFK